MTALLALSTSWAAAWAVAFHVATDDHHVGPVSDRRGVPGWQLATHGHVHAAGTPAHGHPVVTSLAAPLPDRLLLLPMATIESPAQPILATARGRGLPSRAGSNHDPPRSVSVSILRI